MDCSRNFESRGLRWGSPHTHVVRLLGRVGKHVRLANAPGTGEKQRGLLRLVFKSPSGNTLVDDRPPPDPYGGTTCVHPRSRSRVRASGRVTLANNRDRNNLAPARALKHGRQRAPAVSVSAAGLVGGVRRRGMVFAHSVYRDAAGARLPVCSDRLAQLQGAVAQCGGRPQIFNTDQGSQFTSPEWTGRLERLGIAVSMEGKGR